MQPRMLTLLLEYTSYTPWRWLFRDWSML